jgi:hypothetical protein
MQTLLVSLLIATSILMGGYLTNQDFKYCESQTNLPYETCLRLHGIK